MIACHAGNKEQPSEIKKDSTGFELTKAKAFIAAMDSAFTAEIRNGDSIALASHYTSDAEMLLPGRLPIKGKDILATWSRWIRTGSRDVTFVTTDVSGCDDLIVETGFVNTKEDDNTIEKQNYVVVYKKENGEWKLYRDIGN